MNSVRYITDEDGRAVEVILPLQEYKDLIEFRDTYEEKLRILTSIKHGAEEIIEDRKHNHLQQELSGFIDELEDNPH